MTQITITPPPAVHGTIALPASKSISNRALIINALSRTPGRIDNLSDCDDTNVTLAALSSLGSGNIIDIGAAGTAMRFLTALLCATPGTRLITGSQRMRQRPIGVLVDALRQLGARIEYAEAEGCPPLRIAGTTLSGGDLSIPGNVSSQYISALLMLGPTLSRGLRLALTGDVISRPYIDMTLTIMRQFGAEAGWASPDVVEVAPRPYAAPDGAFVVENDWSAASYWYQIVALAPNDDARVALPGLFRHSTQGDSRVAQLFERLGVATRYTDTGVELTRRPLATDEFCEDLINQPDLAQTMVATCCGLGLPFRITGLQTLRIKETDRLSALIAELAKLGYAVTETNGDTLSGQPDSRLPVCSSARLPRPICTYHDHRMAMCMAPLAFRRPGLSILDPGVVSKSYPRYWQDLAQTGFVCKS